VVRKALTHLVYVARSPSNKVYVGITNNFKRRLKEHGSSPYPFGHAIRKYGRENFEFQLMVCKDLDEAYEIEELLIGVDEVKSKSYYNISCGGRPGVQMGKLNPMKRPEVLAKHPGLFTTANNPMNDPYIRNGLNAHQKKPVYVSGVRYNGVRDAARILRWSRQKLTYRLKSDGFKDHYYV
jgi:predicted GIY-YIG superfamily endonuclease